MLVYLGWLSVAFFMFWQDGDNGKIRITIDDGKAGSVWPTPSDPCTFTVVASPAAIAAGTIMLVMLAAAARGALGAFKIIDVRPPWRS